MENNMNVCTVSAMIRLYLPLTVRYQTVFRLKAVLGSQWKTDTGMDQGFYLGYITRIFNGNGIGSECLVLKRNVGNRSFMLLEHEIRLNRLRIFSFDTRTAFLEMSFQVECENLNQLCDINAELRLVDRDTLICPDIGSKIRVNDLAEEYLKNLGTYTLYPYLSRKSVTRPESFITVISGQTEGDLTTYALRLSNGMSSDYKNDFDKSDLYVRFLHMIWAISDNGICCLGVVTDSEKNRKFVRVDLPVNAEFRYVIWYILALHQKYVLYQFKNDFATHRNIRKLKQLQENVVDFNTKYRFSVISVEASAQTLYQKMCEKIGLESIFENFDDEVNRIADYYSMVSARNNTTAMTILSLACSVSAIREFYEILKEVDTADRIPELLSRLSDGGQILFRIFALFLVAALLYLLPFYSAWRWLRDKGRRFFAWLIRKK